MPGEAEVDKAGAVLVTHVLPATQTEDAGCIGRGLRMLPALRAAAELVAGPTFSADERHRQLPRPGVDRVDVHPIAGVGCGQSMLSPHPVHSPSECSRIRAATTDEWPQRSDSPWR